LKGKLISGFLQLFCFAFVFICESVAAVTCSPYPEMSFNSKGNFGENTDGKALYGLGAQRHKHRATINDSFVFQIAIFKNK
jgi:hypothetical protein